MVQRRDFGMVHEKGLNMAQHLVLPSGLDKIRLAREIEQFTSRELAQGKSSLTVRTIHGLLCKERHDQLPVLPPRSEPMVRRAAVLFHSLLFHACFPAKNFSAGKQAWNVYSVIMAEEEQAATLWTERRNG
jgi:hypothetical protein